MLRIFILMVLSCLGFSSVFTQTIWSFELMPGIGLAFPSHLDVQQRGYRDISFRTGWRTESLKFPLYYSYRLSMFRRGKGWELELNHLKLRAKNLPTEVQSFSITHGFNHLWLNRVWEKQHIILKTGAGVVIAHPENTVRGMKLDGRRGIAGRGYYFGGPTVHIGMQKKLHLAKHWFSTVKGKLSFAYAQVPVAKGRAKVPVFALHFSAGIGFQTDK